MDITPGSHFSLSAGISQYLPWGAQITLRWLHEFEAEDRFEVDFISATAAFSF